MQQWFYKEAAAPGKRHRDFSRFSRINMIVRRSEKSEGLIDSGRGAVQR